MRALRRKRIGLALNMQDNCLEQQLCATIWELDQQFKQPALTADAAFLLLPCLAARLLDSAGDGEIIAQQPWMPVHTVHATLSLHRSTASVRRTRSTVRLDLVMIQVPGCSKTSALVGGLNSGRGRNEAFVLYEDATANEVPGVAISP